MTVSFKIEILDINADVVMAAFYYDVPSVSQLPGAFDATRQQLGTRLNATDIAALQAGSIYGEIVSRVIKGLTPNQASVFIQNEYAAYESQALANYAEKYTNAQFDHKAFNGSAWS